MPIVNILGTIDDKIENNNIIISTLEAYSKHLYKHWFTDYQYTDVKPELIESELGYIPKGWTIKKIDDVVSFSNTGADAIQKAPIVDYDTGVHCARVGDFSNNRSISSWGYTKITESIFKQYKLNSGDILITRTATLGLNKYIDKDCNAVYNNGLIRIKSNKQFINPLFLYATLNTDQYYGYIAGIEGGSSTRPNMKINYLLNYKFVYPPIDMQDKFLNIYKLIRSEIINKIDQIEKLNELKQLYLKKFFN